MGIVDYSRIESSTGSLACQGFANLVDNAFDDFFLVHEEDFGFGRMDVDIYILGQYTETEVHEWMIAFSQNGGIESVNSLE